MIFINHHKESNFNQEYTMNLLITQNLSLLNDARKQLMIIHNLLKKKKYQSFQENKPILD
jgi:hypothetical protein